MRSIEELERAALTLRATLLNEGKDPLEGTFTVTADEACVLKMQPYPGDHTLNWERDRFCGLKVHSI